MNFAALLGRFSGRATPSLRRNPKAHHTNQTRQESTYLSCEVVQTNEATSFNSFWRNLRSIYQECDRHGHIMSMLVGGVSTYWFTVESIEGIENAALSFVPEEYLSPLPLGATVAMLRRLARVAGLQIDEGAAELIARATGNMPYWARKCGSYIHRNIPTSGRPHNINAEMVAPLVDAFVAEEGAAISEVALRHLFRVHPDLRDAAYRCYSGEAKGVPEPLRRALRRYGVLSPIDELSGTMLSRSLGSLLAEDNPVDAKTVVRNINSATNLGLGEWAEELAVLGRRRNILEKRLRDITVNFIRFDALGMGKQAEVRDRILSVLPELRRKELRHLSAEEAVSKLLWSELAKVIAKEWRLFERIFGDRTAFLQACDLVNDRLDAHAKDADQADLALYRRALRQIEERVAKLQ